MNNKEVSEERGRNDENCKTNKCLNMKRKYKNIKNPMGSFKNKYLKRINKEK